MNRITEKGLADAVKRDASVVITQDEDGRETLKRAKLGALAESLYKHGMASAEMVENACIEFYVSGDPAACAPLEGSNLRVTSRIDGVYYNEIGAHAPGHPEAPGMIIAPDRISLRAGGRNIADVSRAEATEDAPDSLAGAQVYTDVGMINVSRAAETTGFRIPLKLRYGKWYGVLIKAELYDRVSGGGETKLSWRIEGNPSASWEGTTIAGATENAPVVMSGRFALGSPYFGSDAYLAIRTNDGSEVPAKARVFVMVTADEDVSGIAQFEGCHGTEYTAELGQPVYKGYYDWNTGVLRATHKALVLTGEKGCEFAQNGNNRHQYHWTHGGSHGATADPVCTHFAGSANGAYASSKDDSIAVRGGAVWIYSTRFQTASELNSWLMEQHKAGTPVVVAYALPELEVTQLTPQRIPAQAAGNVLLSDCGGTEVWGAESPEWDRARTNQQLHEHGERIGALEENAELANLRLREMWNTKTVLDRTCPAFYENGQLVSCRPVEGYPLEVTSKIEGVQAGSGDPSSDNVREISSHDSVRLTRCGKNLLGFEDYEVTSGNGSYVESCKDGVFTRVVNKTHSPGSFIFDTAIPYMKSNYFPEGTYVFTVEQASTGVKFDPARMKIKMELADGTTAEFAHGAEKEITQSGKIKAFAYNYSGNFNAGDVVTFTVQIERGDEATEHELYRGDVYVAEFGQGVHKGSFNWQTGELTTEWEHRVLDGTEGWKEFRHANPSKNYYYLRLSAKDVYVNGNNGGVICSHWPQREILTTNENNGVHLHNSDTDGGQDRLNFRPDLSVYDTLDKWKAFLTAEYEAGHPVMVAYQRTEPMITQLEPQEIYALDGENCLYGDSGETSVRGAADPRRIISDMESRLAALEAAIVSNA